jgi:hypothetical protein
MIKREKSQYKRLESKLNNNYNYIVLLYNNEIISIFITNNKENILLWHR